MYDVCDLISLPFVSHSLYFGWSKWSKMLPDVVLDRIIHFSDFREKFIIATVLGLDDLLDSSYLVELAPPALLFWFLETKYSNNAPEDIRKQYETEIDFRAAKFWSMLLEAIKSSAVSRKNLQRTLVAIAISDPFPEVKDEFYEFIATR